MKPAKHRHRGVALPPTAGPFRLFCGASIATSDRSPNPMIRTQSGELLPAHATNCKALDLLGFGTIAYGSHDDNGQTGHARTFLFCPATFHPDGHGHPP